MGLYQATTSTPGGNLDFGGGYTIFARTFSIQNGVLLTKVGAYSLTSGSIKVKVALRNSSTSYTIVVDETFSHGGAGWQDFTLSSPYTVPGTGTYHAGWYHNLGNLSSLASTARTYVNADMTGTNTGMTEDTSNCPGVRVEGTTGTLMRPRVLDAINGPFFRSPMAGM